MPLSPDDQQRLAQAFLGGQGRPADLVCQAVAAVDAARRDTLEGLSLELDTALRGLTAAYRSLALEGVEPGTAAYTVCLLVAATIEVGRSDRFPEVRLPRETLEIVRDAAASRVLVVEGLLEKVRTGRLLWRCATGRLEETPPPWEAARRAWLEWQGMLQCHTDILDRRSRRASS